MQNVATTDEIHIGEYYILSIENLHHNTIKSIQSSIQKSNRSDVANIIMKELINNRFILCKIDSQNKSKISFTIYNSIGNRILGVSYINAKKKNLLNAVKN